MSAFYLVAYASLSVPAIVAGVLTASIGLNATFEIMGSIIAGLALVRRRSRLAHAAGDSFRRSPHFSRDTPL